MGIKISALPSGSPLSGTDVIPVVQGAATNKVAWSSFLSSISAASAGAIIATANYTAGPATISVINFSDTTGLVAGTPLKITQAAANKYYIITAVSANTSITVAGPALTVGVDITEILVLSSSLVTQVDLFCPGGYDFEGNTSGLVARATRSIVRWQLPQARLVMLSVSQATVGSGTQPKVNASIAGTAVFSDDSNNGAQLSGTANTWVSVGLGTASLANYTISYGNALELVLVAGANTDSRDLIASLTFVMG